MEACEAMAMHSKVRHVMETNLELISPEASLKDAAQKMRDADCGFLPVGRKGERPMGIITDRDIVVRALADGKSLSRAKVSEYMTPQVCFCESEDSLVEVADLMNENDVSRLLVMDESGDICGVITFGHLIRTPDSEVELGQIVARATGRLY